MLKNYFKIAWRNLLKHKVFSFINIAGLAVGLTCTLLIYLWVTDEFSFDKFHENDSRLFQVMQNLPLADGILTTESTPGLIARTLVEEMPEVKYATSVIPSEWFGEKGIVSFGDRHFKAAGQYIENDYFNIFSWKFIQGNNKKVLLDKHAVFISEALAEKLFGSVENALDKTITWARGRLSGDFIVAGVFENVPNNSSIQFDLTFSYDLFYEVYKENLEEWSNSNPSTYIVLKEKANIDQFNRKIKGFGKTKILEQHKNANTDFDGEFFIQKYSDKYLYNRYENGKVAGGRIEYVRLLSIVALFILVIACINFMNLSTAKASRRLKEVGIKKTVGASRSILVFQYIGETMLVTLFALVIAIVLVELFLPQFNIITNKDLSLSLDTNLWLSVAGITLFTGLLAGSYPALYLSGFNPVSILKGQLKTSLSEQWIRKGLVLFQFAISILLIVSVLVVYQQLDFIQSKNLGYNKDNVLIFKKEGRLREGLATFFNEIKKIPSVIAVSSFGHDMMGNYGSTSGLVWEGKLPKERIQFAGLEVDLGLMEMLDLEMLEGRTFSEEYASDSIGIIFNETAIAAMGLENPVGKMVKLWGNNYQVIGIVKDFHFASFYEGVKPCFLRYLPNGRNIMVKMMAGEEQETIAQLQNLYQDYNQGLAFEYRFLDEDYQAMYESEQRISILSRYFAGLAIFISCLGLFGLAAFNAERRIKEIGIRKVLGASIPHIMLLLSKDFLKLVLIAILISIPIGWYVMNYWLEGFAYRISIQWWVFVVAGASALAIALFTISFQAIRAAIANPVESLKTE